MSEGLPEVSPPFGPLSLLQLKAKVLRRNHCRHCLKIPIIILVGLDEDQYGHRVEMKT
jgi:hypothetical protein